MQSEHSNSTCDYQSKYVTLLQYVMKGWKKYFPFWDHRSKIINFLQTEITYTKMHKKQ